MTKNVFILALSVLLIQCKNQIKNEKAVVLQEKGTELPVSDHPASNLKPLTEQGCYGFWVGYFEKDEPVDENRDDKKALVKGEYYWSRQNKINISIDKIEGNQVIGHSVVAGNDRPFIGTVTKTGGIYKFEVSEPGDNKYDGTFTFQIKDTLLTGTWKSFKKIDIQHRKYELTKKVFRYDANVMMGNRYIDWEKPTKKIKEDIEGEAYYNDAFSTATDRIYEINASSKLLTTAEVANLKKGDLIVIRNAIYARHGFSFKKRPLRVFFDAQDWYVPVYADIKSDFTDIEKKNIELLLRYEKNAAEYYDTYGR
jgi:hypothetical protein